ncbi:hypothetical protein J1N35_044540 [Gossypium stocksii]|uniref:Uncharacterized protein n=1 Tax=Gossypium stocksii TaxID=47602 RepID=A0A9D3U981_9ROSI|nr:hypothetical protein J1N35_044540 [Gossypium stocksii]
MTIPLIHFNDKYIFGVQLLMTKDRILERYIHNLTTKAPRVIEQHLQKFTITLEDVALQLGLLVDGPVVMRVEGVGDWSAICEQLLGKVSDKFSGSRIEMK